MKKTIRFLFGLLEPPPHFLISLSLEIYLEHEITVFHKKMNFKVLPLQGFHNIFHLRKTSLCYILENSSPFKLYRLIYIDNPDKIVYNAMKIFRKQLSLWYYTYPLAYTQDTYDAQSKVTQTADTVLIVYLTNLYKVVRRSDLLSFLKSFSRRICLLALLTSF